jgi:hypothetical protein
MKLNYTDQAGKKHTIAADFASVREAINFAANPTSPRHSCLLVLYDLDYLLSLLYILPVWISKLCCKSRCWCSATGT